MKEIVIVCGQECVYCKKAKMLFKRAIDKDSRFKSIKINYVMEETQEGKKYEHKLVPAFFLGNEFVFEGNPDMQTVKSLLEKCYN